MEAFRQSEVLWWVLLEDYLSGFGEPYQDHNNLNSLKASMVTGLANMPRKKTTLLLMNRSPLQPPRLFCLQKPSRESSIQPIITLASRWPHLRTCPGRRTPAWSHYCFKIQHNTEAEGGFIDFF